MTSQRHDDGRERIAELVAEHRRGTRPWRGSRAPPRAARPRPRAYSRALSSASAARLRRARRSCAQSVVGEVAARLGLQRRQRAERAAARDQRHDVVRPHADRRCEASAGRGRASASYAIGGSKWARCACPSPPPTPSIPARLGRGAQAVARAPCRTARAAGSAWCATARLQLAARVRSGRRGTSRRCAGRRCGRSRRASPSGRASARTPRPPWRAARGAHRASLHWKS